MLLPRIGELGELATPRKATFTASKDWSISAARGAEGLQVCCGLQPHEELDHLLSTDLAVCHEAVS